MIKYN